MVSAGILLLIVGLILWAVAYAVSGPPILARVGVAVIVVGAVVLLVGVLLPLVDHAALGR